MKPSDTELRDSICREMFECGYDQLTDDVKRGIVDRRVEEVRPPTSHDLARRMRESAEWLLSRPEFEIASQVWAATSIYFWFREKQHFLAAARAIGPGEKKFTDDNIEFKAKIPGGEIRIEAPRALVCRLIRPAEYECDSFLSPEEEKGLGGAA